MAAAAGDGTLCFLVLIRELAINQILGGLLSVAECNTCVVHLELFLKNSITTIMRFV